MKQFDIAILGGGPGGYVAAIRAAKAGASVALIEADELGGTCLNRGCIPSKTLLRHSEIIEHIKKAKDWGIETGSLTFSLNKMLARKTQIIQKLRNGISYLLKENHIQLFRGMGSVNPNLSILIQSGEHQEWIQADKVILATGSKTFLPNIPGTDQIFIHTTDTIFDIAEIPKSLAIIGGGVIGVELACIFANLQTEVTIIEMADRIISSEDPDAAAALHKSLKQKGVRLLTSHQVESFGPNQGKKEITIRTPEGKIEKHLFDEVLMAAGRKPNMSGISDLGLKLNGPFLSVNERMETNIPNVYAVGDVIGGLQLAHVASAEGLVAASNAILNAGEAVNYQVVPRCIYTFPEIASVGLSESEAERLGYSVQKTIYPLNHSGKAMASGESDGFMKIIADKTYGQLLGVVIVGAHATEMISEASAFIYLEGTVDELAKMIHPHPTISEGLFEGANAHLGVGIHM
ncbi:dihydrolipoamide dehydrogenase [Paenibacillus sp. yr247]|uniref:dihydrolipoyl dehydrogenase n=1 Tax=Paenibacillus sp. yr247 TaxID=1761880 RepID=UPI000891BA47|nr:dihydrolipoyl dehydrogenase [Paenibacillus sp. yr247]SDO48442.1 dihydrolipoamide dehydrogenase [Paenibacillus sp. yr247]